MPTPRPAAMWPLVVTAGANDKINLVRGGAFTATVAAGTYYSPSTLAAAVAAALTAAVANAWAVTVSSAGRVTVAGTSTFQLLFSTGANAAISPRDVLGFGTVDTALATSAVGQYQHQNAWYADDPVVDDTGEVPVYDRSQGRALGGRLKSLTFATRYDRTIRLGFLEAWKVWRASEGAKVNEAIERLFDSGWARFRWFPDQTDLATGNDYALSLDTAKALPRERLSSGAALYSLPLRLFKYV